MIPDNHSACFDNLFQVSHSDLAPANSNPNHSVSGTQQRRLSHKCANSTLAHLFTGNLGQNIIFPCPQQHGQVHFSSVADRGDMTTNQPQPYHTQHD